MKTNSKKRYNKDFKKPTPENDISDQAQIRGCLKCSKSFHSEGHHNRICRDCKELTEWCSSGEEYYSMGHQK